MKISVLTLVVTLIIIHPSCKRSSTKELNLDFEQVDKRGKLPDGWIISRATPGKIELDFNVKHKGKCSLMIENEGKSGLDSRVNQATRIIKNIHPKNSITVSAFIKTENVTSDSTGLSLWSTTFSGDTLVTLKDRRITGTNDWQQFSVTIPVKEEPDYWFIGVLQIGKGKIWIDDIKITIDGDEHSNAPAQSESRVSDNELLWLKDHCTKLNTVKAGESFEDLQPLKTLIGDARIIG
jgi:hypothetical protein